MSSFFFFFVDISFFDGLPVFVTDSWKEEGALGLPPSYHIKG